MDLDIFLLEKINPIISAVDKWKKAKASISQPGYAQFLRVFNIECLG